MLCFVNLCLVNDVLCQIITFSASLVSFNTPPPAVTSRMTRRETFLVFSTRIFAFLIVLPTWRWTVENMNIAIKWEVSFCGKLLSRAKKCGHPFVAVAVFFSFSKNWYTCQIEAVCSSSPETREGPSGCFAFLTRNYPWAEFKPRDSNCRVLELARQSTL